MTMKFWKCRTMEAHSTRILRMKRRKLPDSDGSEVLPYSGTYYIAVSSEGYGVGAYELSPRQVFDREGTGDAPTPLTIGMPLVGSIDYPYDSDWFSFEARAGAIYGFDLGGPTNQAGHYAVIEGKGAAGFIQYTSEGDRM